MPYIAKITGGAGTRKTSHLIRQIVRDLDTHFMTDICAVSLTRAAADVLRRRLFSAGVQDADMRYVGTIHSIAYQAMPGKKGIADTPGNLKKFYAEYPSYSPYEEDSGLFSAVQNLRATMTPKKQWPPAALKFHEIWTSWMRKNDMTDFTGIIEECLASGITLPAKIIYVDETQDQTPLATALIMMWAQNAEKLAFYGDDDQSLYRFSGADPEGFITMPSDFSHNRPQSYRCPRNILHAAMQVIRKCKRRIDKEYAPITPEILEQQNVWRAETGQATYDYTPGCVIGETDIPDLSLPGGHFILVRTNYQLARWRDWLIDQRIPFSGSERGDKTLNPAETKLWTALKTYRKILSGESVPLAEMQACAESGKAGIMFAKKGAKKRFMEKSDGGDIETFGLLAEGFSEPFVFGDAQIDDCFTAKGQADDMAMWLWKHNPAALVSPPAVTLGTVHAVKGMETENVWLDAGSTAAIHRAILSGDAAAWDDECRVAYVAITRARRTFGILENKRRSLVL